jgi:hypothetical protein
MTALFGGFMTTFIGILICIEIPSRFAARAT